VAEVAVTAKLLLTETDMQLDTQQSLLRRIWQANDAFVSSFYAGMVAVNELMVADDGGYQPLLRS